MPRRTAPQTKTAICCLRESAMRGTLRARLMVAKERIPSVTSSQSMSGDAIEENLHIAATIWVSRPNWFWKPPAK